VREFSPMVRRAVLLVFDAQSDLTPGGFSAVQRIGDEHPWNVLASCEAFAEERLCGSLVAPALPRDAVLRLRPGLGFTPHRCRPSRAQPQGKVESAIKDRQTPLRQGPPVSHLGSPESYGAGVGGHDGRPAAFMSRGTPQGRSYGTCERERLPCISLGLMGFSHLAPSVSALFLPRSKEFRTWHL
jgi:hypothetical protein